ncbi:MAG: hypothetical protein M3203_10980 [Actinomycetota bacterium]|nr:hypothetical protein [Actinomycetota bacterium]
MIDEAFSDLRPLVRTRPACELLGKPRATHYRRLKPRLPRNRPARPAPANALTLAERQAVLDTLHAPEHADLPPAQVWARLLDDGTYLASVSTMYRLLRESGESRDRRRQRTHPARTKPQLLATTVPRKPFLLRCRSPAVVVPPAGPRSSFGFRDGRYPIEVRPDSEPSSCETAAVSP